MPDVMLSQPVRHWSVDSFKAFWASPKLSHVPNILGVVTKDIVGYWPRPIGTIRDPRRYVDVINGILTICPDFSLRIGEHASTGDFHFIRWIATGTGPEGRFEFTGCDRVQTRDGQVCENYVFCDHPFFGRVAEWLASRRTDS